MTHISSLPLSLTTTTTTTTTTTGRKGGKKAAASSNNRVVRWPGRGWDVDDDAVGEEDAVVAAAAAASSVSSYRFRLTFRPEEEEVPPDDPTSSSSIRYAPKPIPIQISVSRGGRLFKLGTATVLLSGEEDGRTSVNVPIASCNHSSSGVNRFRDMLRGKVRMMRLSGDTLSCGMDPNATLRVLVRTTDPESVGGGGMTTVEEAGGPGGFRVTIVPKPIPTSSVVRECRPPSSVTSAVDRQECDRPIPLTATAPSPMRVMDRWEKVEVCADDSRSFSSSSSSSSSSSYSSSSTSSSSLSSSTTTTTSSSSSSFCEGEEATHKEDISCSSSAYMSVHKARSSSTATTLVSDMTDCNSRKSLEVEATRPPTDRGSDDDAPTAASTRGGAATWRQRFTCGLPACLYNDPGDALMDVLEDHRNLVVERCDKIRFTPKASYSTDGGESFIISSRSGSSQSGSEL
ncbi:hypothetical protein ACHAW5_003150 [Stephanodiscus triporus]|uniref:Uncharacterized protein n=1 Tax=Stephanodiscus triporus TaxID=2934178 RepID=A0ABD3NQP2_9STRA